MLLQDLPNPTTYSLQTNQTLFRIQTIRPRAGALVIGPVHVRPPGQAFLRFDVPTVAAGYFSAMAATSIYETLVRREATTLSLAFVGARQLLSVMATTSIKLLDLRPYTTAWPVLQSMRYTATQQLSASAVAAGYEGLIYASAQHPGENCFVLYGNSLAALQLVRAVDLVKGGVALHRSMVDAIRGGQIPLGP